MKYNSTYYEPNSTPLQLLLLFNQFYFISFSFKVFFSCIIFRLVFNISKLAVS